MLPKILLSFFFVGSGLSVLTAQVKPIRKGMLPTQVVRQQSTAYYKVSQLGGKWQEIKRTPLHAKDAIAFTDTLLMQFDSNKVEIKDATSMRMTMRGDAYIDPPYNLIAAGDEYVIKSLDKTRLVLSDGENVKEMEKRERFYFETLGKLTVQVDSINTPIKVDPKNLVGKWIVYRRQAMAGTVDGDAAVIKSIDIFPSNTTGSAMGQVVCYKTDVTESLACKIVFDKENILVITDRYVWEFNTYKADGKEFVFGEVGQLVYYAKH